MPPMAQLPAVQPLAMGVEAAPLSLLAPHSSAAFSLPSDSWLHFSKLKLSWPLTFTIPFHQVVDYLLSPWPKGLAGFFI